MSELHPTHPRSALPPTGGHRWPPYPPDLVEIRSHRTHRWPPVLGHRWDTQPTGLYVNSAPPVATGGHRWPPDPPVATGGHPSPPTRRRVFCAQRAFRGRSNALPLPHPRHQRLTRPRTVVCHPYARLGPASPREKEAGGRNGEMWAEIAEFLHTRLMIIVRSPPYVYRQTSRVGWGPGMGVGPHGKRAQPTTYASRVRIPPATF